MLLCGSWSLIGLCLGFFVSRFSKQLIGVHEYTKTSHTNNETLVLIIYLCICSLVLALYISKLRNIPLFTAFGGDAKNAYLQRSESGNAFENYSRYSIFTRDVLPFVLFSSFSGYIINKNIKYILIFILSFTINTIATLANGERSPLALTFIFLYITFIFIRNNKYYFSKYIIIMSILSISTIYFMFYIFSSEGTSYISILSSISGRTLTGQISPAYFYINFFPAHQDFLSGLSLPNPGGLLPYTPYRITYEVWAWAFPELARQGIVGSMPTIFWAEAYANFGYAGVMLAPVLIGIWASALSIALGAIRQTPMTVGFIIWAAVHFQNLAGAGLSQFILDFRLMLVGGLFVFGRIVSQSLGSRSTTSHMNSVSKPSKI